MLLKSEGEKTYILFNTTLFSSNIYLKIEIIKHVVVWMK